MAKCVTCNELLAEESIETDKSVWHPKIQLGNVAGCDQQFIDINMTMDSKRQCCWSFMMHCTRTSRRENSTAVSPDSDRVNSSQSAYTRNDMVIFYVYQSADERVQLRVLFCGTYTNVDPYVLRFKIEFDSMITTVSPNTIGTHCIIHVQVLAVQKLPLNL
jgi:hypothetical protein